MRWTLSAPIEIHPSEVDRGIQLRLEPLAATERIEGIVLAPDATPVAGALVSIAWHDPGSSGASSVRSGEDGRFLAVVDHPTPHDCHVDDPKGRWPSFSKDAVAVGTLDLELRFSEGRWSDLEIHDPGGQAIETYHVAVQDGRGNSMAGVPSDENHLSGKARIMLPQTPFFMRVVAQGFAPAQLGPVDPETVASPWVYTLTPVPTLHGRVTAGGVPIAGARVTLCEMAESGDFAEQDAFPSRLIPGDVDATLTKADGTFQLDQRKGTRFAILCEADGFARAEISPIVPPTSDPKPVEIALTVGGSIEGLVLPPTGHEAAGTLVAIARYDGRPFRQRVGPDGRFSFAHLTPGPWRVRRLSAEVNSSGSSRGIGSAAPEFPSDCVVVEASTTHFDLDLTLERPPTLAGDLTVNGRPASGWMVTLEPDKASWSWTGDLPGSAVDSQGRIRIEVPDPGPYRISLRPPAELAHRGEFFGRIEIRGGENPWSVALSTGSLTGKLATPEPKSRLKYAWKSGDWLFVAECPVDDGGRFDFQIVPAGVGSLSRRVRVDANTETEGGTRSVDVPAEGTVEVEAP